MIVSMHPHGETIAVKVGHYQGEHLGWIELVGGPDELTIHSQTPESLFALASKIEDAGHALRAQIHGPSDARLERLAQASSSSSEDPVADRPGR